MENRNTGSFRSMLVVYLQEYRGNLYVVHLPERIEGKFEFEDYNGKKSDLPVWVVARNGSWYIQCGEECNLYFGEEPCGTERLLTSGMFVSLLCGGNAYNIFVNDDNNRFDRFKVSEGCELNIGRAENCDIRYEAQYVSKEHATLSFRDNTWTLTDNNSRNGIYINGTYGGGRLFVGDVVFVMGMNIIIGAGYLAINNPGGDVTVSGRYLRKSLPEEKTEYSTALVGFGNSEPVYRQPRRQYEIKPQPISVSMPPARMGGNKTPLFLRMASPAMMGGRAIVGGNPLMAVSSMVLPLMTQGSSEKDRIEYEERRTELYTEYLKDKQEEIEDERKRESELLNSRYPDLETVVRFAANKNRLWERRDIDKDFLNVRIGTGSVPFMAEINYPTENIEMDPDPLRTRMLELVKKDYSLTFAPIMLDLKASYVTGIRGSQSSMYSLVMNIILQLAFTHSYDEVKIVVLGDPGKMAKGGWKSHLLHFLPHCWDDKRSIRFIATTKSDACVIGEHLKKAYEDATEGKKSITPSYVVFALDRNLFNCAEVFKDILAENQYVGVSVVSAFEVALKESRKLIQVRKSGEIKEGVVIDLFADETKDKRFEVESCDSKIVESSLMSLAGVRLKNGGEEFQLPGTYSFLQMFNAGKVEYLNPLTRWRENNPTKTLSTPVGIGTDGELFYLDLHQKRQGPHGLIAGMTGSGKSEFIITYILSMAVNYSPDEVAFVLIDYKGGGLASAFEDPERGIHLPHVVGTITNLDGAAIQRSMVSINSELKRRQAVFNEAKSRNNTGSMDIYEYQKLYRAKKVDEPMPHLFLISDEFAELKSQQPEFMSELISTARIGRSLGVHLILATQKPTGVVNDQIWSNTRFRVCMKVQNRNDSMEMLKRPEGADIRETGRFYLQVGYNEYFALGQSAWAGADYLPSDAVMQQKDESVEFLDDAGQVIVKVSPKKEKSKSDVKQLVAIVKYLSDLAIQEKISAKSLWLPPLPSIQDYDTLIGKYPETQTDGVSVTIGEIDDPERQKQYPYVLDLISNRNIMLVGTSGSGKSTFLRTMLYVLTKKYTPEEIQYYLVDLSGGALNIFRDMPHCGAYLTEQDEDNLDRLMMLLRDIVAERKKLFSDAGVTSYEGYIQLHKLPLILLVFDSYTNITVFKQGQNFNSSLHEFMRAATAYGVHVVLSVNHTNELYSRARAEMDCAIALQAKDKYEYNDILGPKARSVVKPPELPGRGVCLYDDRPLEFHTAMQYASLPQQSMLKTMRDDLLSVKAECTCCAAKLPIMNLSETYEEFSSAFEKGRLPIGYNKANVERVAIPFKQLQTLGIYLGSGRIRMPVIKNLIHACCMNGMKLTIVKAAADSILDEVDWNACGLKAEIISSSGEDLNALVENVSSELGEQIAYRDEYCRQRGIPDSDTKKTVKAADYIRAHSVPHMVVFEHFADICTSAMSGQYFDVMTNFFTVPWGYNLYFVGMFYPEDYDKLKANAFTACFVKNQLLMLMGGRFAGQCIHTSLDSQLSRITEEFKDPAEFLLKYRNNSYWLRMPIGTLDDEHIEPDDMPII